MIDYKAIENYLRQRGYSEKQILLTKAYCADFEAWPVYRTKAAGSGIDNPYRNYFDAVLGEPLRQLKELGDEIRRDQAIVFHMVNSARIASLMVTREHSLKKSFAPLQRRVANLEAMIRKRLRSSPGSSFSGPPEVYNEIQAKKEAIRHESRCLW